MTNDEIRDLLDDAGLPESGRTIFTGNVVIAETVYDPDDTILQAVRDAADSEFPNIADWFHDTGRQT